MKILDLEQGTQEWLDYRRTRVTATDAVVIMGQDPYETPRQRWERKLGIGPEVFVTDAMRRGTALEPVARDVYTSLTGIPMMPTCVEHDSHPFMASLDGIDLDYDRIVEIKNLSVWNMDKIPENYWVQMQFQMLCANVLLGDFFSYSGIGDIARLFCIEVDREYHKNMVEACLHFHHCLLTGKPPPLTERDCVPRDDLEYEMATCRWLYAKGELEEAKKCEEEAREDLKRLSDDKSSEGFGVRVRKIITPGNIDYSSIPALEGMDLEKYRKPSYVKWSITKQKDNKNESE